MFRKKELRYIEVSPKELRLIRESLISWRNALLRQGRVTGPIDELLLKLMT